MEGYELCLVPFCFSYFFVVYFVFRTLFPYLYTNEISRFHHSSHLPAAEHFCFGAMCYVQGRGGKRKHQRTKYRWRIE